MKRIGQKTPEHGESFCGVERAARLVGDTWTLLIVRDLANGCQRFGQLQKTVTGISPRTLSDRLAMLEANGLVTRRAYAEIPPRVEYSLTEKGAALLPIIDAMRAFGQRWLTDEKLGVS
jgi:DNA-binding HxlR family transcriptional regulator